MLAYGQFTSERGQRCIQTPFLSLLCNRPPGWGVVGGMHLVQHRVVTVPDA